MELRFSDELLFRGGLGIAAAALFIAVIGFLILGIKGHVLKKRFDTEYGKIKKNK